MGLAKVPLNNHFRSSAVASDKSAVRPTLIRLEGNFVGLEVSGNIIQGDMQLFEGKGTFKDARFTGNKQFASGDDNT